MNSGEQLCLACGLCCDGTLFDNVQLGPGDDAEKVKALGLPVTVSRAQTPVTFFRQPCTALCADRTCRVYADRPVQCRTFECGVFKDVRGGRITFADALRLVKQARRKADSIRRLLRQLGDTDEHRPLGDRFRRTQRRLESGVTDKVAAGIFAELGQAVHQFNLLAHEKFYTKADAPLPAVLTISPPLPVSRPKTLPAHRPRSA
ncbi:MAG: YkgJ family cysteine cluster protein [Lacunisphaera sp.]